MSRRINEPRPYWPAQGLAALGVVAAAAILGVVLAAVILPLLGG
nr:hypothetical protein [Microbispora cellulosiformans]